MFVLCILFNMLEEVMFVCGVLEVVIIEKVVECMMFEGIYKLNVVFEW